MPLQPLFHWDSDELSAVITVAGKDVLLLPAPTERAFSGPLDPTREMWAVWSGSRLIGTFPANHRDFGDDRDAVLWPRVLAAIGADRFEGAARLN